MDIRQVAGLAALFAGIAMIIRPRIVDWIGEQTNLRGAKRFADDRWVNDYDKYRWVLRIVLPAILVFFSIVSVFKL